MYKMKCFLLDIYFRRSIKMPLAETFDQPPTSSSWISGDRALNLLHTVVPEKAEAELPPT
jgi:hypothetical protein